jgi:hypothetical protein
VSDSLPFSTRLWFAFVCFFRVLFDGAFAARAFAARGGAPALPAAPEKAEPARPKPEKTNREGALVLLGLLQREGRLIDFLKQDITGFGDADVGAAARVVHDGCNKALAGHLDVEPVRNEEEGASVTLESGFDSKSVKLVGNVGGEPPYRGTLRHRGWRAKTLELPLTVAGHDVGLLAPAEVEL